MSYRVIQWYTGAIAREQIGMIQRNPELELVGAVVHHEEKAGIDVGAADHYDVVLFACVGDSASPSGTTARVAGGPPGNQACIAELDLLTVFEDVIDCAGLPTALGVEVLALAP